MLMQLKPLIIILCLICLGSAPGSLLGDNSPAGQWTEMRIPEQGSSSRNAAFFRGAKDRGIIVAPGAICPKERLYGLAAALQTKGFTSIVLEEGCPENIAFAVRAFQRWGYRQITLVGGGSAGI